MLFWRICTCSQLHFSSFRHKIHAWFVSEAMINGDVDPISDVFDCSTIEYMTIFLFKRANKLAILSSFASFASVCDTRIFDHPIGQNICPCYGPNLPFIVCFMTCTITPKYLWINSHACARQEARRLRACKSARKYLNPVKLIPFLRSCC